MLLNINPPARTDELDMDMLNISNSTCDLVNQRLIQHLNQHLFNVRQVFTTVNFSKVGHSVILRCLITAKRWARKDYRQKLNHSYFYELCQDLSRSRPNLRVSYTNNRFVMNTSPQGLSGPDRMTQTPHRTPPGCRPMQLFPNIPEVDTVATDENFQDPGIPLGSQENGFVSQDSAASSGSQVQNVQDITHDPEIPLGSQETDFAYQGFAAPSGSQVPNTQDTQDPGIPLGSQDPGLFSQVLPVPSGSQDPLGPQASQVSINSIPCSQESSTGESDSSSSSSNSTLSTVGTLEVLQNPIRNHGRVIYHHGKNKRLWNISHCKSDDSLAIGTSNLNRIPPEKLPGNWTAHSFSGATANDLATVISRYNGPTPSKVILSFGMNERNLQENTTRQYFTRLVAVANSKFGADRCYYIQQNFSDALTKAQKHRIHQINSLISDKAKHWIPPLDKKQFRIDANDVNNIHWSRDTACKLFNWWLESLN